MRSTALWLSILLISVVTVARGADDAVEFLSKYELAFFRDIPWWDLYPMPELLARQPGDAQYDRYVSLLGNDNATLLVAYVPQGSSLHLSNGSKLKYAGRWYDPVQGIYRIIDRQLTGITIELGHGADYGMVLLLQSN